MYMSYVLDYKTKQMGGMIELIVFLGSNHFFFTIYVVFDDILRFTDAEERPFKIPTRSISGLISGLFTKL